MGAELFSGFDAVSAGVSDGVAPGPGEAPGCAVCFPWWRRGVGEAEADGAGLAAVTFPFFP